MLHLRIFLLLASLLMSGRSAFYQLAHQFSLVYMPNVFQEVVIILFQKIFAVILHLHREQKPTDIADRLYLFECNGYLSIL
ncbi:hypothetical protein O77CONTIG1_03917 [Leptolyngbya sp. O-77]|nr:hypothetical protein O77CONTIG1_03917 [Leptolyngbya sp. O-77]